MIGLTQMWWFLARSSGLLAWAAATASILVGLGLTTTERGRSGGRRWMVDIHRTLSGLAVVLVVVHLTAVIADSYEQFTFVDLLVPFASKWRSGAVAWGILAMYVLLVIEVTSLLRDRISRRLWAGIHESSLALFWLMSAHAFYAGTDSRSAVAVVIGALLVGAVGYLTVRRLRARWRRERRAPTCSLLADSRGDDAGS